ncbi:NAD(+) synthase [Brevundimonas sp. 2R-24]|uniref:Glutamine-dependent NAD(+) synthetase n=1 Tax=Peiella sedimenti TaxID=3061083 RepID=A0ABT8SKA4_9CAUL|nr:NAD(+) synthase [Caulobacteraceae bacterium XZ-24]
MATADHPFFSFRTHGFVRAGAATPMVCAANPAENARRHIELARQAHDRGCELLVFPELSLSGYAIDDLLMQDAVIEGCEAATRRLIEASADLSPVLVVGAPVLFRDGLFNCGLVIHRGRLLGVVPKTWLPNYREYYEKRWFRSGAGVKNEAIGYAGQAAPFGVDLIFEASNRPGFTFNVEICEDYWAPAPPSTFAAMAGARILCNLSASNVLIGKSRERALLSGSQSVRAVAAYIFSASGFGESTTDLAWDGQSTIHEMGDLLAAGPRFSMQPSLTLAEVDVGRIGQERLRNGTFAGLAPQPYRRVGFEAETEAVDLGLEREIDRFPFVPDDPERLDQDCFEAFNIQVQGLARRLQSTSGKVVIGVSGGLDSTHALLVACRAMDALGKPRTDVLGFTMPGFGTSDATKSNAWRLMKGLGITADEIDIRPAALAMLEAIGHPYARGEPVHDVTFENVQAGLRTDHLFRLANQRGGLVLGTGDLSEIALGWSTYGVGDQMSHYNVNGGVPKTLIQHLIRWVADREADPDVKDVLAGILATPISPELKPATLGEQVQDTQAVVGPYELQDFTLYYASRYGLKPSKIAFLLHHAWSDVGRGAWPPSHPEDQRRAYDLPTLLKWLEVFVSRFYGFSQFKRSAMPNGPKVVGGGSLSPRGDWRAPSDVSADVWLEELRANTPHR